MSARVNADVLMHVAPAMPQRHYMARGRAHQAGAADTLDRAVSGQGRSTAARGISWEIRESKRAGPLRGTGPELLCGAKGIRTPDPLTASEVRYQLRHSPECCSRSWSECPDEVTQCVAGAQIGWVLGVFVGEVSGFGGVRPGVCRLRV